MLIVRTRLRPPTRGAGRIDRHRFAALADEARRRALTLVKAPAGYGKSSILSQSFDVLATQRAAVGWLSVERIDSGLVEFSQYLLCALRESRRNFGDALEMCLHTTAPAPQAVAAAFVDDVLRVDEDVFLFIDDFHLVSDPKIGLAMSIVLTMPPANLHFVIASRQSLPFCISRLRMCGLVTEIYADALRFDRDDARAFLRLAGHSLSESEIDTVVTMTEGWAAAIQLASISLTQRKSDFFRLVSGEQEEMSQFLTEDVIENLPASTVEFMEKTSVLTRLCPDLCNVLTGRSDAREQIDAITCQSLFLFSLDDQQNWYRYHHMFAAFLTRRLRDRDPRLVPRLHRKASAWFAKQDLVEEAFAHAIDARDYSRAATILERSCKSLFYDGQLSTLLRRAQRIPDSVLREFPRIRLEIAWSITLEWQFGEAGRIIADVERSIPDLAVLHGELWLANISKIILHRKMMLSLFMDDMPNVEAVIDSGRNGFPDEDPYLQGNIESCLLYARRELYKTDGVALIDAQARDHYRKAGSAFVHVWHESALGPTWFLIGEPERAISALSSGVQIATRIAGPSSALAAMPALLLSEILYERNERQEAEELLLRFGSEAERMGFVDQLIAYYITWSRLKLLAGDTDAARATLNAGRASAERRGFERLLRWVEHEELRQLLAAGDFSCANAVINKTADPQLTARLEPGARTTSRDEALMHTWARAMMALGRCDKAAETLRSWVDFAHRRNVVRTEIRALIALATCLAVDKRDAAATRCLREAVSKAAKPRFIRSFLDEGRIVETLLRMLFGNVKGVFDNTNAFGRELVELFAQESRCGGSLEGSLSTNDSACSVAKALTCREREVLRMVASGLSNKEIGSGLGLTEGSVKWYMQQLFAKLEVRRRASVVHRAQQLGIL